MIMDYLDAEQTINPRVLEKLKTNIHNLEKAYKEVKAYLADELLTNNLNKIDKLHSLQKYQDQITRDINYIKHILSAQHNTTKRKEARRIKQHLASIRNLLHEDPPNIEKALIKTENIIRTTDEIIETPLAKQLTLHAAKTSSALNRLDSFLQNDIITDCSECGEQDIDHAEELIGEAQEHLIELTQLTLQADLVTVLNSKKKQHA